MTGPFSKMGSQRRSNSRMNPIITPIISPEVIKIMIETGLPTDTKLIIITLVPLAAKYYKSKCVVHLCDSIQGVGHADMTTIEKEFGSWGEQETEIMYYIKRFEPTCVRIKHRGVTRVMPLYNTLKMLQWQRSINKKLYESADEDDKHDDEDDYDSEERNTVVTEYSYYNEVRVAIGRLIDLGFMKECSNLYSAELLAGQECPVLLQPLEVGKTVQLKCNHLLSLEAWQKQKGTCCPLCRADSSRDTIRL